MKLILVNSSVVLVTKNAASAFNHDILFNHQVIPTNFQKKQDSSFNTPAISRINYTNGFNITTESNNKTSLQFLTSSIDKEIDKQLESLQDISSRYIKFLGSIEYQALGMNFHLIADALQYNSCIAKLIQKNSSLLSFQDNTGSVNRVDISYNLKGKKFNVALLQAEKTHNKELQLLDKSLVPSFFVNVHYPGDYCDNKESVVKELKENYSMVKEFIEGFR